MNYTLMKELPVAERPRERLLQQGGESLSNRELLAIILRSGTKEQSVFGLVDALLAKFGSLRELAVASWEELTALKGIGPAKAADILAACELAKRLSSSTTPQRQAISQPADVAQMLMAEMRFLEKEYFIVVMLNTKHRVIAKKTISVGHLNASLVHPRELFKESIRHSSAAVILVHNHPSGDPTPSDEDISLTSRLCEAGQLLGIHVLDHLIMGDQRFVSFKERGLL